VASRIKPQRLTPAHKHVPDVLVKKPKETDAQPNEQSSLKKFEDRDQPQQMVA
jgi:hypothetical protein